MSPRNDTPLQPLLRMLKQHGDLAPDDEAAILDLPHNIRTFEPNNYMVREGDRPDHCLVMLSGFCFRHKILGDGSRSISSLHMAGDTVDLHNALLPVADHSVQALTRCEVAAIPAAAIRTIAARFPKVGTAMWRSTLVDGSVAREWTANVGRRDAPTRLMHLLCEFGLRLEDAGLGDRLSYELPMTQEQLADATGLTSVHINRTLKELEARGLIDRRKRSVAITDWVRAEQAGDFNPSYLHLSKPVQAAA